MGLSAEERDRVLQNALDKLAAETGKPFAPDRLSTVREPFGEPATAGEPFVKPAAIGESCGKPVTAGEPKLSASGQALPFAARKPARIGKKRRFARFIAILAAVLAAGLLTAGATGLVDTGQMLYQIFGAHTDPEMIDALGIAGYPIGQSQTQGGYTVTLQGVIGDRKSCYVIFDIAAPESVVLGDKPYGFSTADMNVDCGIWSRSCGYYLEPLDDEDPTDNVVSFLFSYDGDADLPGRECTISLQTFVEYVDDHSGDGEWDNEKIVAGERWDFIFQLDYQDVSVKVPVREPIAFNGKEAQLADISISPLSVQLEYRQPILERLFGGKSDPGETDPRDDIERTLEYRPAVVLHFRDGSEFAVGVDADGQIYGGMSASASSSGISRANVTYSFDRPIDTAALVSVDIDGVNFPIG